MKTGQICISKSVVLTWMGFSSAGPYLADTKNNDAAILNHMLQANIQGIRNFLQEGYVLVVDRGFIYSLSLLGDLGIQAEMRALMKKGQKQMPTKDANASRLVTKEYSGSKELRYVYDLGS